MVYVGPGRKASLFVVLLKFPQCSSSLQPTFEDVQYLQGAILFSFLSLLYYIIKSVLYVGFDDSVMYYDTNNWIARALDY